MNEDEIVERMEAINKTAALFDWLEMLDGHTVGGSFDDIISSTCVYSLSKPDNDIMKALGLG